MQPSPPRLAPADRIELEREAREAIGRALDLESLEEARSTYLGRQDGKLTVLLRSLSSLSIEERRHVGPKLQALKLDLEAALSKRAEELKQTRTVGLSQTGVIDTTEPGESPPRGAQHLVTRAIEEISDIFLRLGFERSRHPEVDWDWYAFESLNMPPDHPARDDWETFFIDTPAGKKGRMLLTPHTSNGQVRQMEIQKPPIRMINIARCFRRQIDASHVPMFHQFEGLVVDRGINLGHLKGVVEYFVREFFGQERGVRFRPHHFQFTEPSFEIDISCGVCAGIGCRLCKGGWLELAGAGMTHPNVLRAGGVDPKKYTAFAFGWGIERCALMKSGLAIPDIRILYQNDLRFLTQFT